MSECSRRKCAHLKCRADEIRAIVNGRVWRFTVKFFLLWIGVVVFLYHVVPLSRFFYLPSLIFGVCGTSMIDESDAEILAPAERLVATHYPIKGGLIVFMTAFVTICKQADASPALYATEKRKYLRVLASPEFASVKRHLTREEIERLRID